MAASDAVSVSVPSTNGRLDGRSPLPPAPSKRDRKRQAVMERLAHLHDKFQSDKDSVYRDQLQRIQYELNSIQNFDVYASDAFEKAGELQRDYGRVIGSPYKAENARTIVDMAGKQLPQFLSDIQDLLETRDFQLTRSKDEYDRKALEYKNTHTFKTETAKREHEALNTTMRDRLINQLNVKKSRLTKEREVFEICETNALLLNPAQFSLTNPGSPGGHPGKRSTRNRREADDGHDSRKRKRNGDEDDGSPAPTRRGLDVNGTTPYWQSEKGRNEVRKQGATYTINNLFTDKELSMNYNTAALASHHFMVRHRNNVHSNIPGSPEESDAGNGDSNGAGAADAPNHSAPAMERQVSHATRSTQRATTNQNPLEDKLLGIEGIGTFELPSNLDLMHGTSDSRPIMPSCVPLHSVKAVVRNPEFKTRPLSVEEAGADLQLMKTLQQYDATRKPGSHLDNPKGFRKTLEAVAVPYTSASYVALKSIPRQNPSVFEESLAGGAAQSNVREQTSPNRRGNLIRNAAPPMSRQSSAGGVAMSRQGTAQSNRGKVRKG
ncbi:hypothetical protein CDD81_6515 [Ophiocordyceps australis]|uniref:Uncharacterized protein n=1 Tax=Ophiocordyceps australis TaxID=1399860 RepID=A0A2C5XLX3_9HYPO|nr:hypothetical protein CDD81_6515 [Ophiocordyceps australis]